MYELHSYSGPKCRFRQTMADLRHPFQIFQKDNACGAWLSGTQGHMPLAMLAEPVTVVFQLEALLLTRRTVSAGRRSQSLPRRV